MLRGIPGTGIFVSVFVSHGFCTLARYKGGNHARSWTGQNDLGLSTKVIIGIISLYQDRPSFVSLGTASDSYSPDSDLRAAALQPK